MVKVKLFGPAKKAAGCSIIELDVHTGNDAIEELKKYSVELEKLINISQVWVNGEKIDLSKLLNEGDELAILPPMSGGSI